MNQQNFPVFFTGDPNLFNSIKEARIKDTLMLPQPSVLSQSIVFTPIMNREYLEPVLTVIVLNETQGQQIIKGSLHLAQTTNTIFVYYPYQLQVDQFVYKQCLGNYESIVKEVPRQLRDYFCKYVQWKQGKGDHSIQHHRTKLIGLIERQAKTQIERRVASLLTQMASIQQQAMSFNKMFRIWSCRTKLIILYRHLNLNSLAWPLLQAQYTMICNNLHLIAPCIIANSFNPVRYQHDSFFIKMERNQLNRLDIVVQIYLLMIDHLSETLRLPEATDLTKCFLVFVRQNVFGEQCGLSQQILRKLWQIQLTQKTIGNLLRQKNLMVTRKSELEGFIMESKLEVRKTIHWIGRVLFGFSPNILSINSVQEETRNLITQLRGQKVDNNVQQPKPNEAILAQLPELSQISNVTINNGLKSFKNFIIMQSQLVSSAIALVRETKLRRLEIKLKMELSKLVLDFDYVPQTCLEQLLKHDRVPPEFNSWTQLSFVYLLFEARVLELVKDSSRITGKLLQIVSCKALLPEDRNQLLKYINSRIQEQKRYRKAIGTVDKVSILKSNLNQHQVQIQFKTNWPIYLTRLVFKFADNLGKNYDLQLDQQETLCDGKVVRVVQLTTEEVSFVSIKSMFVFSQKISFQLSVSKTAQCKLQLQNVRVGSTWPFGQQVTYPSLYTPIRFNVDGINSPQTLKMKWTTDLQISSQGWLDGSEISMHKIVQLKLSGESSHTIQIYLLQNNKKEYNYVMVQISIGSYVLKEEYACRSRVPIHISFKAEDKYVQYKLNNTSGNILYCQTPKGQKYQLKDGEELSQSGHIVSVGLSTNLMNTIQLSDMCEEKININTGKDRFALRLQTQELKLFKPVRIRSQQIGTIRVTQHEGYELVGKTQGVIGYRDSEQHILDLGIIPTRKGKIILPSIEIRDLKGEWKHPVILQVIQS